MTDTEPRILARIDSRWWGNRPESYRDEVRTWLRANNIDPNTTAVEDIEVVLVDGPAITYTEYVVDASGRKQLGQAIDEVVTRRVHSLLRVPLPAHLDDGTSR